jgi:hypothetical protein
MNDLTRSGPGGSLVEVPEMSQPLRGCVDRCRTVSRFMGDEDDKPEATITAEWITPKWVSESLRDEAARLLPFYDRLSMTVSEQSMLRWLNVLWMALPKGRGMATDWEAVKTVYTAMLDDFPALCFSKRSMIAARDRFKWFPSTNELAAFLTPYRTEINNAVFRLRVISKTTTERGNWTPAPERPKRTEAELRSVADICAGIRDNLKHGPAKGTSHVEPSVRKTSEHFSHNAETPAEPAQNTMSGGEP